MSHRYGFISRRDLFKRGSIRAFGLLATASNLWMVTNQQVIPITLFLYSAPVGMTAFSCYLSKPRFA